MCGYFGNLHECPAVLDLLNELGINIYPLSRSYNRRPVEGLITAVGDGYQVGSAIWWFHLSYESGRLQVDPTITSFNARDLTKPMWKRPLREQRGIVFATEIGESQGQHRYLMRAPQGLAMGCLYKDWIDTNGEPVRSMAVITRPPHARFSRYHNKSVPCFLPLDADFLRHWLDPAVASSPVIDELLDHPRLYTDFEVQRVKTYKHAQPLDDPEVLPSDEKSL